MTSDYNSEPTTLADLAGFQAARRADSPAVIFGDRCLGFRELDERSNAVANGLANEQLEPGDRIAFLDRNSEQFFEALFGVVKVRSVFVTINFRLAPLEVEYILNDSKARVLFVATEYLPLIDKIRERLPELRKLIVLDDADGYETWLGNQSQSRPDIIVEPTDGAVQMYTSGTTGHPKGVELSHAAMVQAAVAGLSVWPFLYEDGGAVLGTMPLFHIAAANLCIAALYAGATAVIVRDVSPQDLAEIIPEQHITLVPLPATVIHAMLRLPGVQERDFSALRTMLVAGSGIAPELVREAGETFQCGFALSYGSTETCGGMTYLGPEECTPDAGDLLGSAGKTLGDAEIRIADEEGNELPRGDVGEILCRSSRLMTSYWRKPEATRDAIRDGWFWSGDAGYLDEEGYLFVVDRIKDMVLSGGENIYPTEIEHVIHMHEDVEDVAVVGIPDEKWGEALLAFIVVKEGRQIDGAQLEGYLRDKLAGFKIPRRYEFVGEFPRNATGKVLKRELRKPYWEGKERNVG
ncbi:MAG: long-chain-fatty-acid--CoA ligase [Woeseiaceae bacterium]